MLILSTWTAGSGTIAAPAQPAVISVYTLTSWNIAVDLPSTITGRVALNIAAPAATLAQIATDYRFPPINYAPVRFGDYQTGMRLALANRLSGLSVSVTIPGGATVTVPATPAYQSYLAAEAARLNAGLTAGSLALTNTLSIPLPAGAKTITVAVALGFYKLYQDAVADWSTTQAAIECAQQVSDLDAITIA